MVLKIATFVLFICLGLLLLNNGIAFGFASGLVQFLRTVGGSAALIAAVALALE